MIEKILIVTSTLFLIASNAGGWVLPDILDTKDNSTFKTFTRTAPTVQIGILLDTSGSMNGLINQAKDQLWKIVNEVSKANKDKKDIVIEVGLFEYGKSSIPRYEGYLQMLSPLTTDLDKVSDELFKLRTNGGEEYAGKVILESVNRFAWSTHKDDLKLIIIAGNEAFTQGNVPYSQAIRKARRDGIIVNTIFCGNRREGIRTKWLDGANRGGGKYFTINHNNRRKHIDTPYDDTIITLGNSLNNTYMSYGTAKIRKEKNQNRLKQDANSQRVSKSSYIERNFVKSKSQYAPAKADMVSAYMVSASSIEAIEEKELPKELQGKSKREIRKVIEAKKRERIYIQNKIKSLEKKRERYLSIKNKNNQKSLGYAIIKTIRQQAKDNGFIFKK